MKDNILFLIWLTGSLIYIELVWRLLMLVKKNTKKLKKSCEGFPDLRPEE